MFLDFLETIWPNSTSQGVNFFDFKLLTKLGHPNHLLPLPCPLGLLMPLFQNFCSLLLMWIFFKIIRLVLHFFAHDLFCFDSVVSLKNHDHKAIANPPFFVFSPYRNCRQCQFERRRNRFFCHRIYRFHWKSSQFFSGKCRKMRDAWNPDNGQQQ